MSGYDFDINKVRTVDLDLVLDDEDIATIEQLIRDFPENQENFEWESNAPNAQFASQLLVKHKYYTFPC